MRKIVAITSKYSKSGAEIIYVDGVKTSRAKAEAMYENRANSNDIYIWAVGLSGFEIMELVRKAREEMPVTYNTKIVNAEVEVEVEVEEIESADVTVAAATFETVEVKAVEFNPVEVITISGYGKAIKLAAVSKNVNNSNDFNNICKAIKLAAISKNVNNFKNISSGGGVAKGFNLAAEKLKAGGVSIRGSPFFIALLQTP